MLTTLGGAVRRWTEIPPWTNVYGLARTVLALGTLGTLLFTSTDSLFRPATGLPETPYCDGLAGASLFCVVPADHLELGRLVGIALLVLVASGWRPRLTAIPHWWVAVSLQASATIPDGGDQVSAVVTLLLLPIALTDRRRWHWQRLEAGEPAASRALAALVAWSASVAIRVQVAGVYLQSSVAKLGVAEWVDGTALYYWLHDPLFGAPGWARGLVGAITETSLGVLALTWVPLVIEFALVFGLVARRPLRPYLLTAGIALHLSIATLMGLWSFALAMVACLVLFLRPLDESLSDPRPLLRRVLRLPAADGDTRPGDRLRTVRPPSTAERRPPVPSSSPGTRRPA
jgi:antimicrobial peptide system SdpB family protein